MVSKLPTSLRPAISPSPPLSSSSSLSKSLSSCSSIVVDSSSSSSMGDLIGTESGVYMSSNEEEILKPIERRTSASYTGRFNGRYWDRRNAVEKEYPPPIPSLARTGNLPGRMPWVFRREYTHDGRLILREKRVQRHEYFYARRDNGRLILKLIPMDEQVENEEGYNDLELEDLDHLQFVEKDKGKEKIVEEEEEMESKGDEEENEHGDGDDDEDKEEISKFTTKFSATYASGMFMDSKQCFCCNGVKVHEGPHRYLDQSSSSSSVPLRPVAAVM
ncbi:uncharacterized protein LOC107422665 isoform X2 [Ziziphus jujuba]|nr:uncharacterized protein LOC107422665 isoform X2 [Ziziphus jujuba]